MTESDDEIVVTTQSSFIRPIDAPTASGEGDAAPVPESSSAASSAEIAAKRIKRRPLDYFLTFFETRATVDKMKGESDRKWTFHSGYCKLCVTKTSTLGKEITGWDTYANFQRHVDSLHASKTV